MGASGVQSYALSHKDIDGHSDSDDVALTNSKTIHLEEIDLED